MIEEGGIVMHPYAPEGFYPSTPTPEALHRGVEHGDIFQALCTKCDEFHNLHVDLGFCTGIIPREEAALGINEGITKEYAILSRVGKPVCFQVLGFDQSGNALLSRRTAQADAKSYFMSALRAGDILPAVVQNPSHFGVFCDIGCGIIAMMRIDRCCVSRLQTTADHYTVGQKILAAIYAIDDDTGFIHLTGRELLGTWEENANDFRTGQTVPGTVRSVMPYGIFVELTPNLSGLAETIPDVKEGDAVSVYIRAIQHDRHKIKLNILQVLPKLTKPKPLHYHITEGRLDHWEYFPGSTAVTYF